MRSCRRKPVTRWGNVPGLRQNLRGPNRALALDEQLEIQRLMKEARAERRYVKTAQALALRYGVSNRTIYRYIQTVAVPPGFEVLSVRVRAWAIERGIDLTLDDVATLLYLIQRHRDFQTGAAA